MRTTALAIFAHPDDIEYFGAGTLLLLRGAGFEIHYFNLSSGSCGSIEMDAGETRRVRLAEAQNAATILGATFHPPICDDLEIFYNLSLLRKVAAVVRQVKPSIVLTHPPQDYMEDHANACRLAVTAAFTSGMPNFVTDPPSRDTYPEDVFVYHSMPHGLCDQLRVPVTAGSFVDTSTVIDRQREALAAHASQQDWLDHSQGANSYLQVLDSLAERVGQLSGKFAKAEGWRRHLHLGYSAKDEDPLAEILGERYLVNPDYPSTTTS
ncbi:MAG: PIG-L family deacetylase [Akkermansiaceae bacterium]|jgi:LmbE family N-acetylglucosaminyl deacetylase|nr:PIG-L family deacetylase [Akkermansiaceae bacterium]